MHFSDLVWTSYEAFKLTVKWSKGKSIRGAKWLGQKRWLLEIRGKTDEWDTTRGINLIIPSLLYPSWLSITLELIFMCCFWEAQTNISEDHQHNKFSFSQNNLSEARENFFKILLTLKINLSEAREHFFKHNKAHRAQKDITEALEQFHSSKDLSEALEQF